MGQIQKFGKGIKEKPIITLILLTVFTLIIIIAETKRRGII